MEFNALGVGVGVGPHGGYMGAIYYMDTIWMLHGRYVDTSHHHPLSFGATSCMERLTEFRVMSYAILYMDGAVIYRKFHQTVI